MSDETEEKPARDEQGRFLPGYSGNPSGRPAGTSLTTILKDILEEPIELMDKDGHRTGKVMPAKEAAMRKLLTMAMNGDRECLKYLIDRVDGRPLQLVTQNIDLAGDVNIVADADDQDL